MIRCLALFAVLGLFNSWCCAQPAPVWDHLVFSQQWPMSVCIDSNITHRHNCSVPKEVTTWTVHGIWPTHGTTEGPNFCNKSAVFDPDKISNITDRLDRFWPNLYTDSPPNEFWEHEWNKHGTCAVTLEALDSELKYFTEGLRLREKFDLLKILKSAHIEPTDADTYPYPDFVSALLKGLGVTPTLTCAYDKSKHTQYILEIEFCLNKTFDAIECPHKTRNYAHRAVGSNSEDQPVVSMVQQPFAGQFSEEFYDPQCYHIEPIAFPVIQHTRQ